MWAQESDMGVGVREAGWQEMKKEAGGKDVIVRWHSGVGARRQGIHSFQPNTYEPDTELLGQVWPEVD